MGLSVAIVHVKNVNLWVGNDGGVAAIVGRGHLVKGRVILELAKSFENSTLRLGSKIVEELVLEKMPSEDFRCEEVEKEQKSRGKKDCRANETQVNARGRQQRAEKKKRR